MARRRGKESGGDRPVHNADKGSAGCPRMSGHPYRAGRSVLQIMKSAKLVRYCGSSSEKPAPGHVTVRARAKVRGEGLGDPSGEMDKALRLRR